MQYPTIQIQGSIFLSDILEKISVESDMKGQQAKDFGLDKNTQVKEEINAAWSSAIAHWNSFQRLRSKISETKTGTSETRNSWMLPLLSILGYKIEASRAEIIQEKSFAISHKDTSKDNFPVHIMGCNDSLDKKRETGGPRMSPHALLQEYLNLSEHLYGIVTNGLQLRLLRNSTRLIKLSYVEFDLEQMFEENHFADFALMFRLLHASRMPINKEEAAESYIEQYHQDSLESGERIRDGLSQAVKEALEIIGNGFLQHQNNEQLLREIENGSLKARIFYTELLHLIYRFLFLLVIEERGLIFPENTDKEIKKVYNNYYSISALRKKADRNFSEERPYHDLWIGLLNTFAIFESENKSKHMNIHPLGGLIFSTEAIVHIRNFSLNNNQLLEALRHLSSFIDNKTHHKIRVNYGRLNVEEFGSVYENLLDNQAELVRNRNNFVFSLVKGTDRSSSGSHYTPDELVKPLIENSLDHLIKEKLRQPNPEKALLTLRVCDISSGSGHILLNAARRIGFELAKVRSGEDQPTPSQIRLAFRDVISHCIYGVDLNPMAVELCKVALWLEAHNPGEPLNFLDHHIRCGNSIVGLAHKEELLKGIPDEAFKTLAGDDKEIAKILRNENRTNKTDYEQLTTDEALNSRIESIAHIFQEVDSMPEHSPAQIQAKSEKYTNILSGSVCRNLKVLADIQTAQFFIAKTQDNLHKIIRNAEYFRMYRGAHPEGQAVVMAMGVAAEKKFFHWFLEFPEIFMKGGFDCILGNPPFLGGQKLSGNFGNDFLEYVKFNYAPIGSVDMVTYFFRRAFSLIKEQGFQALISTNTIAQGSAREGGLAVINEQNGSINFAVRSMKWPGLAAVEVSLVSIYKGKWEKEFILDNKKVNFISSYLDDQEFLGEPFQLKQNENKSFQGSIVLGKGFVLEPSEAEKLILKDPKNKDVLFPYLNGDDLNNRIDQSPSRWVINFFDYPLRRMSLDEWQELSPAERSDIEDRIEEGKNIALAPPDYKGKVAADYPDCLGIIERDVKPERVINKYSKTAKIFWWLYERYREELYRTIAPLERVLSIARVTKICQSSWSQSQIVTSDQTVVFAFKSNIYFVILNSTINNEWAWKNCSTMGGVGLRYTPSDAFQTFPFPQNISPELEEKLEQIGEEYHEFRKVLMQKTQLGLTKLYNQFHNQDLAKLEHRIVRRSSDCSEALSETSDCAIAHRNVDNTVKTNIQKTSLSVGHSEVCGYSEVCQAYSSLPKDIFIKKYGKETYNLVHHLQRTENTCTLEEAVSGVITLRELHKKMDELVL